jgi:uncharacterized protein YcbK (DUF882 family)
MKSSDSRELSRRDFCTLGAMAAVAALMPTTASAVTRPAKAQGGLVDKSLSFFNTHTHERLVAAYCCDGEYDPAVLARVNYVLRDHRANEVKSIDVDLLDLLHRLNLDLQTSDPYHVISGYRSPSTNALLRAQGGKATGVATKSLHMVGKAIDIRVPGVPLKELHKAAVAMKRGGVGIYPSSDFVHVDVGRVRYWSGK